EGVGGSLPAGPSEPSPSGRLRPRLHVDLGLERYRHRPAAASPLQRRALPFADLRARPLRCVRPDRVEGHGRRDARTPHLQRGARHLHQVRSYELVLYEPSHRDDYLGLLREAWGPGSMSGEEFDWWFDGNPAGSLRSVAVSDGRVVGVAAHSLFRIVLAGEERVASF